MTSVLPVLAGDMFENLGWGKGGTLLACIALVAVPAPALVSVYYSPAGSVFELTDRCSGMVGRCGRSMRSTDEPTQ